jgi:hypothetical protein
MMLCRLVLRLGKVLLCMLALPAALIVLAVGDWLLSFRDSVTLPNGMQLKREFNYPTWDRFSTDQTELSRIELVYIYLFNLDRHDLYSSDGSTLFVKDVDLVCFDDHHVDIGYDIFDGAAGGRQLTEDEARTVRAAGLAQPTGGCNGYFTGMLGPELLYPGNKSPFRPSCEWRNRGNPALRNPEWLNWPCDSRQPP